MVKIRKIVTVVEEILSDGGREARRAVRKAAAVVVLENPFAGRFVDDLTPLIDAGEELGALLAKKATEALGAPPTAARSGAPSLGCSRAAARPSSRRRRSW